MRYALAFGLLLLPAAAFAQAEPPPTGELIPGATSPFRVMTSSGPVTLLSPDVNAGRPIREIRVERVNVFDLAEPGEDWWPFRMANKVHVKTQEAVVRRELLLDPGQPWDPFKGLESERNLRSLGIFRRADITPVEAPGGKLDLNVRTQDSWTTIIDFSAGTEGGEHFLSYGASEGNLFGRGKAVSFNHEEKGDRHRTEWNYDDPRLLGSRVRLTPFYALTDKGDSIGVSAIRPFFSLDTPYATGASWERTIDESILWKDADEYSRFLQRTREVFGAYGTRLKQDAYVVQRLEAGWYSRKDDFHSTDDTVLGTLPRSRELSGPMLGYSWVQPRYIKETYVDRMERVEDFNMGNELSAFAGWMGEATGSDRDRFTFNVMDQQGLFILPGRFFLAQVGMNGRVADQKWDNAIFFANLNAFWKAGTWLPHTLVGHIEANTSRSLDGENQVILGGENGLRGYKNNSFTGARSVLVNLEDRVFFPGEYFHLVRFGAAAFFDSGAVVPEGSGFSLKRFKSDVGFGFRMASTRSESGGVVRFDLAYAVNDGPGRDRWVVAVKGSQAFQIFNSSTRKVRQTPGSQLGVRPSR